MISIPFMFQCLCNELHVVLNDKLIDKFRMKSTASFNARISLHTTCYLQVLVHMFR